MNSEKAFTITKRCVCNSVQLFLLSTDCDKTFERVLDHILNLNFSSSSWTFHGMFVEFYILKATRADTSMTLILIYREID